MRESLECECGGLSCYNCRVRASNNYPGMTCAHGKPVGIICERCIIHSTKEMYNFTINYGYYSKGNGNIGLPY